jgi:hypothetical protein
MLYLQRFPLAVIDDNSVTFKTSPQSVMMAAKPSDLPSLYASPPVAAAIAGSSTPAGGLLTGGYPGPSRIPAPSVTPGTVPSVPSAPNAPGSVESSMYGPSLYAAAAAAAQAYLPFATASENTSFYSHHLVSIFFWFH